MNYTYIVMCKDGTYYTGWTNNLQKRIDDHNGGKGAKYTKSRLPVELVYYETFDAKEDAMRREYAIKQLSRKEKEVLIKDNFTLVSKNDMIENMKTQEEKVDFQIQKLTIE